MRAAGLAFMTPAHLGSVGEALADASVSHPRVHSVWLTLLSLLIPGFTPVKVGSSFRQASLLRLRICSATARALKNFVSQ